MATPLVIKAFTLNQKMDNFFLRKIKVRLQWNIPKQLWTIENNPSKSFYIEIYGKLLLVMCLIVLLVSIEYLCGLRFLTIMTKVVWSFMILFVTFPYLFDLLIYFYGNEIISAVNFLMKRETKIFKTFEFQFQDIVELALGKTFKRLTF